MNSKTTKQLVGKLVELTGAETEGKFFETFKDGKFIPGFLKSLFKAIDALKAEEND